MKKLWTKGTASAVQHPLGLMRALAPEVAEWRDLRFYLSLKSEGDITS
jgi:hypothetical protein